MCALRTGNGEGEGVGGINDLSRKGLKKNGLTADLELGKTILEDTSKQIKLAISSLLQVLFCHVEPAL